MAAATLGRSARGLLALALLAGPPASGYPLDGYPYTGIPRLDWGYRIATGALPGRERPPGELLPLKQVDLRLVDRPDLDLPTPDPGFTAAIRALLPHEAGRYGVAVLDLSDRDRPRYAEWRGGVRQNPGSVGKLLVALAIFQALADAHPDDTQARERVLRDSRVVADAFSHHDHHTVPFFDPERGTGHRRPLRDGDVGSLWTYLDWMLSPSSNSAAGMLQKHLLLLAHYGSRYPVDRAEEDRFFRETPRAELAALFERAMQDPVRRNGLDLEGFRQGSFFTAEGKRRVPGTSSHATPRGLMEFLLRLEQGRLVDHWSSREIKRLLYVTERRIRYASSPALRDAAVYFKSGSLYSCAPEPGFVCRKYHGNVRNYMNSAAIVEHPAGQNRLTYMVTVLSNVLRKNSAVDHQTLATRIHRRIEADHPERAQGAEAALAFGEGFIGYAEKRARRLRAAEVQGALLELGYDVGEVDGVVGRRTRRGIREFRRRHGLPVSGEVDDALVERLRAARDEARAARASGAAPGADGPAGDPEAR